MDRAASTTALLEAEQVLSERQQELEALQSQRALLADQVELSTLRVHLEPHGVAPAGGPDGFLAGLGTGWRAMTTTLSAIVVVLGVALPWLLLGALVTTAVLVPVRLARRRAPVEAAPSQQGGANPVRPRGSAPPRDRPRPEPPARRRGPATSAARCPPRPATTRAGG
jgi:Domain of unknown function (DUF4349)